MAIIVLPMRPSFWRENNMLRTLHSIPTDGRKLKVAAYARVSTDKYEAEMSLENQIDYYTTLILENPDWEFAGVFADEGISGTSLDKREQFKNMIEKALNGMIDIILVKSISRFGRNVTDVVNAVHQLRTRGVELFLEKENISSLDASATVAFNLYAHLAECEAKSMAENVQWSIDKRMEKGIYRLPVETMLGYRYDENGKLYIVEEEANIVRLVFDMYLKGLSYQFIIKTMMERGYKTAAGKSKWNESTISGILRNEKYVGDCHLHKTFAPKISATTMVVNRGEVDDYYVKDGHVPIITREVWDAACALRKERSEKMGKPRGMKKPEPWPESSFGVCPYCKKNYFIKRLSNAKEGIKHTLTCGSNRSTLKCRESESVFIHDLRNIILEQIKIIKGNPLLFKKLMTNAFYEDLQPVNDKIALINSQIDLLKDKIATYSGKHNDAYKALSDEITGQIENLMNEKKVLENRLLTHQNNEKLVKETIEIVDKLSMTEYDPNFRKLFKKVVIKSRTDLTFIIGNENINDLDLLNLPKALNSKYQIKVRAQLYDVDFGVYFNS